ncbi:hypothetical protein ACSHWG_01155 [Leucobacter sp. Z1108]|uniref:hypothetical protein n=1 Tax=Leucobacter sp. Z1108 TaxID=3439066 RepID=UPI003F40DA96
MSNELKWVDFLDRLPGKPSDRAISLAIGLKSHSAVSRWRTTGQLPKPKQAADVAKAFGMHPLNGLVAAGYLTLDDVDSIFSGKQALEVNTIDTMTTIEIAEYLVNRVREESRE